MIPYNKLTIIRNRHRARDLRMFRELVETYFERAQYDAANDLPVDWEGARSARSAINRMLPRVIQIVHAAQLDGSTGTTTDPGPTVADVDVIRNIFSARYADGADQEILDVIDMALGVYEASRFNALARTVNPFHYTVAALVFVAKIPKRCLAAVGLLPTRRRAPRLRPEDIARLEAVASRLSDVDELIETRFAEMRDRQSQYLADTSGQIAELHERLDFTERVLAQQRPMGQLNAPVETDPVTPT